MAETPKATHVAVHAIGYHDAKKNPAEIKPGTEFHAPSFEFDIDDLEARGAVRKLSKKEAAKAADDGKTADSNKSVQK